MMSYFFSKSSASLATNVCGRGLQLVFTVQNFDIWTKEVADIRVLAAHVFRKRLSIFLYLR